MKVRPGGTSFYHLRVFFLTHRLDHLIEDAPLYVEPGHRQITPRITSPDRVGAPHVDPHHGDFISPADSLVVPLLPEAPIRLRCLGLLTLVGRRAALLRYLMRTNEPEYRNLIQKLGLRK